MEDRKDVEDRLLRETSTMPVFVDQELADLHYNGFSNRYWMHGMEDFLSRKDTELYA